LIPRQIVAITLQLEILVTTLLGKIKWNPALQSHYEHINFIGPKIHFILFYRFANLLNPARFSWFSSGPINRILL